MLGVGDGGLVVKVSDFDSRGLGFDQLVPLCP